jgi:hypothetical protein
MYRRHDPATLLRLASQVLQSRMPTWQARFTHEGMAYRARFEFPGVVSVADDNTGALLARSRPGMPTEMDRMAGPGH